MNMSGAVSRPSDQLMSDASRPGAAWRAGELRSPLVDAVVLSWRSVEQTVACVESVLALDHPGLRLHVVDNGSDNGADDALWRELRARCDDAHRVECGAGPLWRSTALADVPRDGRVFFLRSSHNRGYSGGMNLGLALSRWLGGGDYFLLLNNDLAVHPGAIRSLLRRCEEDPTIGLCGVTQRVRGADGRLVESMAGGFRYRPSFGFPLHVCMEHGERASAAERDRVEAQLFGVHGAAVFGSAAFLDVVGLLGEDRFFYYEEQDWATRGRRAGFRVAWAPDAIVDHVSSTSSGHYVDGERDRVARYLKTRARLSFTKHQYPWALPTVLLAQLAHCALDAVTRSPAVAAASFAGGVDGLIGRHRWFPSMGPAVLPDRAGRSGRVVDGTRGK